MLTTYYDFTIDRCNGKEICKTLDEINDFISDFQVKTWHVESKIDFEKMTDRPTFKSMQLLQ